MLGKLNSGIYLFKLICKAFINKPGKSTKRQFIIDSPRDKVVQRIILRVFQQTDKGMSTCESVEHEYFKTFIEPDCLPYWFKFKCIRHVKG